jgi:hypothetical protein
MGQLEGYGINEMFLTGAMLGLISNYVTKSRNQILLKVLMLIFILLPFAIYSKKSKILFVFSLLILINFWGINKLWGPVNSTKKPFGPEKQISSNVPIELPASLSEVDRETSAKYLAEMHAAKVKEDLASHCRVADHYWMPPFGYIPLLSDKWYYVVSFLLGFLILSAGYCIFLEWYFSTLELPLNPTEVGIRIPVDSSTTCSVFKVSRIKN